MCVLLKVDLLMFFVHMHSITSSAQIQTRISRERTAAWSASNVTRYTRRKKRDFALHTRERKLVHWVDQLKSERERAKHFFFSSVVQLLFIAQGRVFSPQPLDASEKLELHFTCSRSTLAWRKVSTRMKNLVPSRAMNRKSVSSESVSTLKRV